MNDEQLTAARNLIEFTHKMLERRDSGFGISLSDDEAEVLSENALQLENYLDSK